MLKHIVMWRLHDTANNNDKATNASLAKEKLEALNGQIKGLIQLEVGIDTSRTDASGDLILYSEFEDQAALAHYAQHPLHVTVVEFMQSICKERQVVDYTI